MFLFCNEDKKKKERLNSVLKTTRNLIKKNDIKDVRKNPVYSLIRAMSNYHLYDIVRELYEDEEVTDVQSIYKDIGEYLINSDKLNNSKSFELGESNINIDLSKDAILVCAWNNAYGHLPRPSGPRSPARQGHIKRPVLRLAGQRFLHLANQCC